MHGEQEDLRKALERSIEAREKRTLIQETTQGRVDLNINPCAIPLLSADPELLYNEIIRNFKSTFDTSEILNLLPEEVRHQVSPQAALKIALQNEKIITFRGGLLSLEAPTAKTTQINGIAIGSQTLAADVNGSSEEAMFLCKTVMIALWRSTGIDIRWDDLERHVALSRFTSTTIFDMPFPLMEILSDDFKNFINEDVSGESGFGKYMGYRDANLNVHVDRLNEYRIIPSLKNMTLLVSVFNTVSGRSEDCELNFLIRSRTDANRNAVQVRSELPTEEHVEMVEALIDRLSSKV